MKLVIYTDGASRGNPGAAAYGFTIADEKGRSLHEGGGFIGITTNNMAEYTAVWEALKWVGENVKQKTQIEVFADSKLVAEQLSGRYKIKSPHLKPITEKIQILALDLGGVTYNYIPRWQNTRADKLANKALDSLK